MTDQKRQTPLAGGASNSNQETDGSIIDADALARKRVASLKATLALRGFAVHDTAAGGWLVARWDRSHYCPRIADLEAFLKRIGGEA